MSSNRRTPRDIDAASPRAALSSLGTARSSATWFAPCHCGRRPYLNPTLSHTNRVCVLIAAALLLILQTLVGKRLSWSEKWCAECQQSGSCACLLRTAPLRFFYSRCKRTTASHHADLAIRGTQTGRSVPQHQAAHGQRGGCRAFPHMQSVKNCSSRSVIKYVQLPALEVDTELLQDAMRREAAQQKAGK